MSETYNIKNNNDELFITVKNSVPGIITTSVSIILADGTVKADVVVSDPADSKGNIPQKSLGISKNLIGATVNVHTNIILTPPSSNWQTIFNNLSADYTMAGGASGQTGEFVCNSEDKQQSSTGQTIEIDKNIDLANQTV